MEARLTPARRLVFGLLLAAVAFSLGGSLALRLNPDLSASVGALYVPLVQAPTWTYMATLPLFVVLVYLPDLGWRRTLACVLAGTLIGGGSELLGTTTGVPFGDYLYTAWLGPKLLGHVPWLIPPSWFAMSLVSYDFAGRLTTSRAGRVALVAVFMTAWDVSLDPAMSNAFPFWTYPGGGSFFGMPLTNWLGWFGVSLVIGTAYEALLRGPVRPNPAATAFYAVNCLFPILMSLVYGLEWAALVGLCVTGLVLYVVRIREEGSASRVAPAL